MPTPNGKPFKTTLPKGLPQKEGVQKAIRQALRKGGDYRGATYDPKTGKATVI